VELAIRTAMLTLGGSLLEQLLAADTGHCGQRVDCGDGHQAEFVSYRAKTIETVLGPVALRRAYYHCAACGHGVVPRDDELGVAGTSLTPGLRKMVARTGAAVPSPRRPACWPSWPGSSWAPSASSGPPRPTGRQPPRRSRPGQRRSGPAPWSPSRRRRCRTCSTPRSTAPASP